jgi:hypothetical protein
VKIALTESSRQALGELLSEFQESELLNCVYPAIMRSCIVEPLLDQLRREGKENLISLSGRQRELLLRLLSFWEINSSDYNISHRQVLIREMLDRLQPIESTPIGAEKGDYVVLKKTGALVEILQFDGGIGDEPLVCSTSKDFIVVDVHAKIVMFAHRETTCDLKDLMWPPRLTVEEFIWRAIFSQVWP